MAYFRSPINANEVIEIRIGIHSGEIKFIVVVFLFVCMFTVFHPTLYGDVTIIGEGLQNLGLCSALRAFDQGGIFIMPHLL
jgi:hypothetical protein